MDINSIFFSFNNVENKLKADNTYTPKSSESDDSTKNDGTFTFEYINKSNDLIFPLYYTDFMDYPNKNEIINFNKFLLDKYSKEEKFKNLIEQLLLKIRIPCDILAKYWLRAYTLESNFYKEMNDYLENKLGNNYDIYVKVLYYNLKEKLIKTTNETKLYRGAKIKKEEIEYIKESLKKKKKDLPGCICFNKSFLSSSTKINIAFDFMKGKKAKLKEDEELVLYEFNQGNKLDENNISNSDIKDYSFYKKESEVLFFPFSSFEIIDEPKIEHKENIKYYSIHLNYLGKYRNKIDKSEKITETTFTESILKTEILEKIEMNEESQKFDFNIGKYISEDIKKSFILATYEINNKDLNKKIQILNCNNTNKEELKKICDIYYEDKKIDFTFEYSFNKTGNHTFKFIFKDLLTNANKLFYKCELLKTIDCNNFKTNYIKDMTDMFNGCSLLECLDLSSFKTTKVSSMKNMFFGCISLKDIDLSSFNTISVNDMSGMFSFCNSLTYLNLKNFKTKIVKYMNGMFNECKNLKYINLSSFETNELINMSEMFSKCSFLISLNLTNFNTYNVKDMNKLFYKCSSLNSLDLNNFNTSKVSNMENMFSDCISLNSLDLSSFDTKDLININGIFNNCSSLKTLNLCNLDISNIKNINEIFINCNSLTTLNISKSFKDNNFDKNKLFEGINKDCKIICENEEYKLDQIINDDINDNNILNDSNVSGYSMRNLEKYYFNQSGNDN